MEQTPHSEESNQVETNDSGSSKKKKKAARIISQTLDTSRPNRDSKPEKSERQAKRVESETSPVPEKPIDRLSSEQAESEITDLDAEETKVSLQQAARARLQELAVEQPIETESDDQTLANQASREFLESVAENGELDLAVREIGEAYGLDPDMIVSPLAIESDDQSSVDQDDPTDGQDMAEMAPDDTSTESESNDQEAEPDDLLRGSAALTPLTKASSLVSSQTQNSARAGNAQSSANTGSSPPLAGAPSGPNLPPFGPTPPPPQNPNNYGGSYLPPPTYNQLPNAAGLGPNTIAVQDAEYLARRAQTRGLLVGGIVGYLVGRRRGRIKTQKKLLPVQKKLQKKVSSLQHELLDTEFKLREQVAKEQRSRLMTDGRSTPAAAPRAARSTERLAAAPVKKPLEARPNRPPPPAQERLRAAPLVNHPEHLGHVLVAAEAASLVTDRLRSPRVEVAAATPQIDPNRVRVAEMAPRPTPGKESIDRDVLTMSRTELLLLSEKISVDGANLRQIYETHLLGEKGLRKVVAEYLRGGDMKRVLRRELIAREIDYEKDPLLRERAKSAVAGGGRGSVDTLLAQAGVAVADQNGRLAVPQLPPAANQAAVLAKDKKKHPVGLDVGLGGVILALIGLIIVLLFLHHAV